MTYPVLPPTPPAIFQDLPPEQITAEAIATTKQSDRNGGQTSELPPGSSEAALLGPPLEVSSPLRRVETTATAKSATARPSGAKQLPSIEETSPQPEFSPETEVRDRTVATIGIATAWMKQAAREAIATESSQVREIAREATGELPASTREVKQQTRDVYPNAEVTTSSNSQNSENQASSGVRREPASSGGTAPSAAPPSRTPNSQGGVREGTQQAIAPADTIELKADLQEYDRQRQIATGEGNAVMRARGAVIDAERLQVNLASQVAIASGDAIYTKGQQVLRGDRMEYDIAQNRGGIEGASGDIFTPTTAQDLSPSLPTDVSAIALQQQDLVERLRAGEPPKRVRPTGAVTVGVGAGRGFNIPSSAGSINRVRFEADRLNFNELGWEGTNVRITNDPFSPPELEFRSPQVTFRSLTPEKDEIVAKRGRLVFDDRFSLPILKERVIIDRSDRDPSLIRFGYDRDDRGGVYAETTVVPPTGTGPIQLNFIPQYYLQRSLEEGIGNMSRLFGLKAKLSANPTPRTLIQGETVLTNFDFSDNEENIRGNLRVRQMVGNHAVSGEYTYRDRLFNGSLGYQTVHQNVGLVVSSPPIGLGKTGINLSYQASAQYINADTDRIELLEPMRENNRIDLSRYQASAALSRGFLVWQGDALPRTPTQGLRYTPAPVVPYVRLFGGVTGVATRYGSEDTQNSLTGSIGIQGQFGHFSRRWLDYTGFNLGISRVWQDGESPFLFDRIADSKVLSAGLTQQIYGPFRFSVQTAFNLDTGERISTDLSLEYSRRAYGVNVRYNPEREVGSLSLQINDFNWLGGGESFSQ